MARAIIVPRSQENPEQTTVPSIERTRPTEEPLQTSLTAPDGISIAGGLRNFVENWKTITLDKTILSMLNGCKMQFKERPSQTYEAK